MNRTAILTLCLTGFALGLLSGCASTQVTDQTQNTVMLPRPGLVYVYNFAVSPDEVTLQRGIGAEIRELAQKEPRTEQEIAVGHQVADALARHLVKEIQALGFPTYRTSAPLPAAGNNLAVKGQFISIDEGNRTERVLIGLGAGRTDVKTMVQVYEYQAGAPTVATRFSVDAKSGRQPGMAESMGAGAIAGHLATSAAVSAGAQVVGQKYSATVEADADRTAKDIAKQLKQYFVIQGWMRP